MIPDSTHAPLTVLEVTPPPDGTTRYIDQIVTTASPSVEFKYFNWKRALRGRYDVLHVHWPERLLRRRSRTLRIVSPFLLALLLGRLKMRRVPIIRTLHNVAPHETGSPIEQFALKILDRATDLYVTINPVTAPPRGTAKSIPHGHYRARFAEHPRSKPVAGALVYAGLIRPYKGVERLIEAFISLPSDLVSQLRIVGSPTPSLREHVENARAKDPRISARLEFVPDSDLVAEITRAELVCLPYDEMHNSGMALVGLSLDRPILVPDTDATRALESEVGVGWIQRFRAPFDAKQLEAAINRTRLEEEQRSPKPTLEDRDWELVSQRYEEAFRDALRLKKRSRARDA